MKKLIVKYPAKYIELAKQHLMQRNSPYEKYTTEELDLLSKSLVEYLSTKFEMKIKDYK